MIGILVSTYNGEKYIEQQLDSLVQQSYKDFFVFIRDDGSQDSTVEILEKYCEKYDNFSYVAGCNVGYSKSFMELLKNSPLCDFYAFCDQDDFWEKDKLCNFLEKNDLESIQPSLYYSNYYVCDESLNIITNGTINLNPRINNIILQCPSNGMTMIINTAMRDMIIKDLPDTTYGHDWWICLVAVSFGKIIVDERPTVRWRRLDNSLTGKEYTGLSKQFLRLRKIFGGNRFNKTQKQILEFNRIYGELLEEDKKKLLNLFIDDEEVMFKYFKKIMYKKSYSFRKVDEILFRICILFRLI